MNESDERGLVPGMHYDAIMVFPNELGGISIESIDCISQDECRIIVDKAQLSAFLKAVEEAVKHAG
jgi:hypothetical protein